MISFRETHKLSSFFESLAANRKKEDPSTKKEQRYGTGQRPTE